MFKILSSSTLSRIVGLSLVLLVFVSCEEARRQRKQGPIRLTPLPENKRAIERVMERPASGALVYIPVYSSVYEGSQQQEFPMTVTLSIRNTDPDASIVIKSASYYNTKGDLLREFVLEPILLSPLQTREVVIEQRDTEGGTGANFMVTWLGSVMVSSPMMEAITVSYALHTSFVSRGQVVQRYDSASSSFRQVDSGPELLD